LIARIWGDIMIWDAENLPGKNHSARKFSQAGSCRDSQILKNRKTTGFAMEPIRANEGRDDVADRPGAVDTRSQVRKNTNQRTPRIRTARPVEMATNASIDGPGSACRASVGVSTI
jgi:hypothetical protein